jgi:Flp pilus assembly protein TadD
MLLIVLVGVLVYGTSLGHPLLFDDATAVSGNLSIRQLSPLSVPLHPPAGTTVAGRPLTNLTFALNYAMGGLDLTGYRVTNLVIHLLAALALYGVVRRTLVLPHAVPRAVSRDGELVALGCALLWVVHPLASEPVVFVAQRGWSLMGLFYLLTLYASIRAAAPYRRDVWTAAAVAASFAGMLSHEVMATAPLAVAVFDRVFLYGSWREAWDTRKQLYGGLAATWAVLAGVLWFQPPAGVGWDQGVSWSAYAANQPLIIARYLWLSIWPQTLVLDYGLPRMLSLASTLVPALAVLAVIAGTVVALRKHPALGYLGVFFLLTLAPSSGLVPIATEVGAERRMYLPLVALTVLVAGGLYAWLVRGDAETSASRRRVWMGVVALACVLLGVGTVLRAREFRSDIILAESSVNRWPQGRARVRLAAAYATASRPTEALAQLRLAVSDYPPARLALARQLLGGGNAAEAVSVAAEFIRIAPNDPQVNVAHDLMGRAYVLDGRLDLAAEKFDLLTRATPGDPAPFASLGDIRLRQRRFDEALALYQTALSLRPNDPDLYRQMGLALSASRRMEDAVEAFARAVAARPNDISLLNFLGRTLGALGRYQEAVLPMRRLVELAPTDSQARQNLAVIERLAKAQADAEGQKQAAEQAPSNVLTGRQ